MTDLELLSRLLDGDLDETEAMSLRARILTEPELAAAWDALRQVAAELAPLEEVSLPEALIEEVLDAAGGAASVRPAVEAPPTRWVQRSGWVVAALAVAAAAVVAVRPVAPTALEVRSGSQVVDGHALVQTDAGEARVDGRVRIEASKAGVVFTVLEGEAQVGDVRVGAGESHRWTRGVELKRPASPEQPGPELERRVRHLEFENSLLRGRLVTHEGTPSPWPADAPEAVREEALAGAFAEAFQGEDGELVGVDCEEYPCLLLVAGRVPSGARVTWDHRLEGIRDEVGPDYQVVHRRFDDVDDGWQYSYAAHALVPAGHALSSDVRLQHRMEDALLAHWPDWVPYR